MVVTYPDCSQLEITRSGHTHWLRREDENKPERRIDPCKLHQNLDDLPLTFVLNADYHQWLLRSLIKYAAEEPTGQRFSKS